MEGLSLLEKVTGRGEGSPGSQGRVRTVLVWHEFLGRGFSSCCDFAEAQREEKVRR